MFHPKHPPFQWTPCMQECKKFQNFWQIFELVHPAHKQRYVLQLLCRLQGTIKSFQTDVKQKIKHILTNLKRLNLFNNYRRILKNDAQGIDPKVDFYVFEKESNTEIIFQYTLVKARERQKQKFTDILYTIYIIQYTISNIIMLNKYLILIIHDTYCIIY